MTVPLLPPVPVSKPGVFQLRLFAGFAIVIVLALGTVSLYVMQGAEQEIEVYEELTDQLYLTRMEHWLLGYHARGGSWDDVRTSIEEMGVLSGRRIILTDPDDQVLVDSRQGLVGEVFEPEWPNRELISYQGVHLGTIYAGPEPTVATVYKRDLARSIGFFLFWGSLAASIAALILTALLARRLTAPIRLLVAEARRIGAGDFSVRISLNNRDEFSELATAFNGMVDDLARAEAFRKNFVADIAHELRTPLSNIRGYMEAVEDELVSPEQAIETVKEDALLLNRLVEDLQDLALADTGALAMVYRLTDPADLLGRVVAAMTSTARSQNVTLTMKTPAEPGGEQKSLPRIVADPQRITQVLGNLLENAILHSGAGGTVAATVEPTDEGILFRIADTGPGIPEDELEQIFDRFHRVDKSRTRSTGGSGLGLTISRHLVQAHGGTIVASNRNEGGSEFTVELPLIPHKETGSSGYLENTGFEPVTC